MKKLMIISILTVILMTGILPEKVSASDNPAGASAMLTPTITVVDNREEILTAYLKQYNSPLVPYVHTIVTEADRNNIDYRLLVAISGVESTFGKNIPTNSYNGWGWGIYGTNTHYFHSWDDAIGTISSGLKSQYIDQWKANDVYAIGKYYAASPTWASRVYGYMNDIDSFGKEMKDTSLSISL